MGAPWVEWIPPPPESQCVPLVCEKFAENPEFRVGNCAVNERPSNIPFNCTCYSNFMVYFTSRSIN